VKRTSFFVSLLFVAVVLLSTSCGTGDKIGSVSMTVAGTTGVVNLAGLGGTLQLQVNANYTSGKFIDETNFATYTITAEGYYTDYTQSPPAQVAMPTPPLTLNINSTGMITAVDPAVCSWVSTTGVPATPGWAYTGDYKIVATYRGFTSNPVFIPLASAANGQTGMQGQCGPS
jgi:hypothetical protein